MDKFKKVVLKVTKESELMLRHTMPNFFTFADALYSRSAGVYLDEIVLLREGDVKDEEDAVVGVPLYEKYKSLIEEGKTSYEVNLTHFGWCDCALAFKVDSPLFGIDGNNILVAAVYGFKDKREAKKINKWLELKPITIETELKIYK